MDLTQIKETDIWTLYERSINYCRMMGNFDDTDRNYRMYNGDQWYGLKIKGVEKIQYNFIKPIVRYKTGIVMTNLYGIVYSSENFEQRNFRKNAELICKLLNKKAARIWEKDYMDLKLHFAVKDAAVNGEGIIYVTVDPSTGLPVNELLDKTDVFYGNENDSDIQSQPYILIKQRKPVVEVQQIAKENGVGESELLHIAGDNDNMEQAGEDAKYEKDEQCTLVTKLYKENGTVHFAMATRRVDIRKDTDSGLTLYPLEHLIWEQKKGSARGEGEVRQLIPNQLETNKTAMRRAITAKNTAYPQKAINTDLVANPGDVDKAGTTIKIKGGATVEDVAKAFTYLHPAHMSPDVEKLQNELIQSTRELAGAGEIATGDVNPENASGRAILAVQQAAQQPLTEHLQYTKGFVEGLARIWLDILITYNDSIFLEQEQQDPNTGETYTALVQVQKETLQAVQASVKVDITPKGAYDKYAQEQSLENLLTAGLFSGQRMPELKLYVSALEEDSVMPKQKLEKVIENWEKEQQRIAMIQAEGRLLQQQAQQFYMGSPQDQAAMIAGAVEGQLLSQLPPEQQLMAREAAQEAG